MTISRRGVIAAAIGAVAGPFVRKAGAADLPSIEEAARILTEHHHAGTEWSAATAAGVRRVVWSSCPIRYLREFEAQTLAVAYRDGRGRDNAAEVRRVREEQETQRAREKRASYYINGWLGPLEKPLPRAD